MNNFHKILEFKYTEPNGKNKNTELEVKEMLNFWAMLLQPKDGGNKYEKM